MLKGAAGGSCRLESRLAAGESLGCPNPMLDMLVKHFFMNRLRLSDLGLVEAAGAVCVGARDDDGPGAAALKCV
jgi:hypothetical protein